MRHVVRNTRARRRATSNAARREGKPSKWGEGRSSRVQQQPLGRTRAGVPHTRMRNADPWARTLNHTRGTAAFHAHARLVALGTLFCATFLSLSFVTIEKK